MTPPPTTAATTPTDSVTEFHVLFDSTRSHPFFLSDRPSLRLLSPPRAVRRRAELSAGQASERCERGAVAPANWTTSPGATNGAPGLTRNKDATNGAKGIARNGAIGCY